MAAKEQIIEDLADTSDKISTQVRTVSLSIIAIAWLFIVGGDGTPVLPSPPNKNALLIAGGLSLSALVADYFQYLAGYINTKGVLDAGERARQNEFRFDPDAFAYRSRTFFFWLKQLLVLLAVALLVATIGVAIFK